MGFFDNAGGGTPVAAWHDHEDNPGISIIGTILETSTNRATNIKNEPEDNADGSPRMQLRIVVRLQGGPNNYADASKPVVADDGVTPLPDSGERAIYVKENSNLHRAIGAALKAAGVADVEIGGNIWAQYIGKETNPKTGFGYKVYKAGYQAAPQPSGMNFQQPAQQAPAQPQYQQPQVQQQPQYQQAAPPQAQPQPQYAPPAPQQAPAQPQYQQPVPQQAAPPQAQPQPQYAPPAQQQPVQQQFAPPAAQQQPTAQPGFAPQQQAPVAQPGFAPQQQPAAPQYQPGAQLQDPPF